MRRRTESAFGSGNGLSHVRWPVITQTNTDILPIGPLRANFSEIQLKLQNFSFMRMHLKMSSAKRLREIWLNGISLSKDIFLIVLKLVNANGNIFLAHEEVAHSNDTVYPKKYAHGFCFAVLCCGYTLTDFPISIRLSSLALWQSNDCPSVSKATLMNMDKYFMWIHYERLHNHNKAKHNKTECIFLGIYCICIPV